MSIGFLLSSGVGARAGGKFDYIGQLAAQLESLGVTVKLNRISKNRLRMRKSVAEAAEWINQFDDKRMVGHSRGVRFHCDVARKSGRPINAIYSADGWSPDGVLNVPANVLYMAAWYQHEHKPRGSRIHLEGDTLFNDLGPVSGVLHRDMAKLPAFVKAVISAVKGSNP